MRIVQLTPGTGSFYCGTCLRDYALVRALRRQGHDAVMAPMYLPLVLEDFGDAAADGVLVDRILMGGINVYLQQKSAVFQKTPRWFDRILDSPRLLRWASNRSNMTGARRLGQMTVSMLRSERGRQVKEIGKLIDWLASQARPHVVCLSNALLVGLAQPIRLRLGVPVLCTLQGEDVFLDSLAEPYRTEAWRALADGAGDIDGFVPVSQYYADVMIRRAGLPPQKVHVIHNGIDLDGFLPAEAAPDPPVIGYLARLCHQKGLGTLVDAFLILKCSQRWAELRLHAAGTMAATDVSYVELQRDRLRSAGVLDDVTFSPDIDRSGKQQMLRGLTVFSVPATYGEAFGLYVLEALASGVPVVQPRHGAFGELLTATGGGMLCEPDDPQALARAIEKLLLDHDRRRRLAGEGRRNVVARFGADRMARQFVEKCRDLTTTAAQP